MCGIAGTIGFNNTELVERMNCAMTHRGPDNTGIWHDNIMSLGHTRLAVIDTSKAGNQPMSNEDGTIWISFNGEIYNFETLRKDLERKRHRFKSSGDTEIVLHLYEEYKERCLDNLRGMFAFAIWDKKENKLFAARDRFGIKPFFYSLKREKLIFSSELKALLFSGFLKKKIKKCALPSYFTYGSVKSPDTLIEGIFQLLPGHYLIFENGKLIVKRYWKLDSSKASSSIRRESEYTEGIRTALDDAVRMRLVSDVPLGVFLSGGIDSGVITTLMQRYSKHPVRTFSIIFEEKEYDERKFSRKITRRLGTDHTEILLKEKDILKEIPTIFDSMDQPSIDGFNTFIISKAVKKAGLKVALSGLGGDEIFAGYRSFRTLPRLSRILKPMKIIPQGTKNKLFEFLRPLVKTKSGLKFFFSILKCRKLEDLYFLKRAIFLPDEISQLLPVYDRERFDNNSEMTQGKKMDMVNQLSFLELRTYLENMLLQDTDRMSMANSLEVRVPYLDHVLVEKMFEIPGKMKLGKDFSKRLLIKAAGGSLPAEIHRRTKMGFVFPFERWLKGELKYYCAEKFSKNNLKKITFLDSDKVDEIWRNFLKGSKLYNYSSILCILSFVNWYEKNILR